MKIKTISTILFFLAFSTFVSADGMKGQVEIGERPTIKKHLQQEDIENGNLSLQQTIKYGKKLFKARFNDLDGQGRPASTGGGELRSVDNQPAFLRTSGPDANSCAGCHHQPFIGGAGDFVANVFVLAQLADPVIDSISPNFSNERNTLGMHGSGAIEALAVEMSDDLAKIRQKAARKAARKGVDVTLPLETKGVSFGRITVSPDGLIDPSEIDGVDWDLIIKPFHQKGAVVSLREFSNNAMNHHHGMQSVERFGEAYDADGDGYVDELTIGDMTAISIYQATLPVPQQKMPKNSKRKKAVKNGQALFSEIGCATCHIPELKLKSRFFIEPNPYNPAGNLQISEVSYPISWDMTSDGQPGHKLKRQGKGAVVNAYTDLKRHNLCDQDYNHFCNEELPQGSLTGFAEITNFSIPPEVRPTEEFLTRKLWDVADTAPYGHRGDLTTLTKAIYYHGGDARDVRDSYFSLSEYDQDSVVEFLMSLRIF